MEYPFGLEEKIRSNCLLTPTGCLEYQSSRKGYGSIWIGGRKNGHRHVVHRVMYELVKGPIPDGLYVLHACNNKACCNPDHLSAGTQKENMRQAAADGLMSAIRPFARRFPKGYHPGDYEMAMFCIERTYQRGECLIWHGSVGIDGYPRVRIKGKGYSVHRLVCMAINDVSVDGLSVSHSCDTPLCINPAHLNATTQKRNVQEASERGRIARGATHARSILTEDQVIDIVCYHEHLPAIEVAKKFGVKTGYVIDIREGRVWAWLTGITHDKKGRLKGDDHPSHKYPERWTRGDKHWSWGRVKGTHSKLKEEQIPEIRRLLREGVKPSVIAKQFGVSPGTIDWIRVGKTWKHVPDDGV